MILSQQYFASQSQSKTEKGAAEKMDSDDFQSTITAYSAVVDHRLPPANGAHDLGQALIQHVKSEIPVPSKHSLIRSFFEKDETDDGR